MYITGTTLEASEKVLYLEPYPKQAKPADFIYWG
jgi:hypothetical protein